MNSSPSTDAGHELDVRPIPCREKHARIFQRWVSLSVGDFFVLLNDHDPVPLYYQFEAQFPGAFSWDYLERGPEDFRVKITRLAPHPEALDVTQLPAGCGDHHREVRVNVDARGLQPPEPMMRILAEMDAVMTGGTLTALTDREPVHLIAELKARGVAASPQLRADGVWMTTFKRN